MKAYVLDTDVLVAAFRSDTGASSPVRLALVRTFDAGIRISSDPS